MSEANNSPEVLVAVPNDMEAAMIVSYLAGQGIDATTAGDYTAGFRAEAPGDVEVLVRREDLERARLALQNLPSASKEEESQHSPKYSRRTPDFFDKPIVLVELVFIALLIGLFLSRGCGQ